MIFAGILAGGVGSRMNIVDMPKQFLPLQDKPIIIHTLEKFLLSNEIDYIYIGVHPKWVIHMEDLVKKYVAPFADKIVLVPGGGDRNDTIENIINAIGENHEITDEDIILTHDAVRPFITSRIIADNIEAAKKHGACDTVIGSTDTIVVSEDGETISNIPLRSTMYQGQTPQSFNLALIKDLYSKVTPEEKAILTDACKICVLKNVPVHLVQGEIYNLKITTITDYKIANHLIGGNQVD